MWVPSILFVWVLTGAVNGHHVQKRSILDFGAMVYDVTKRNPFSYNGYGNWCGLGGSGTPVDGIDQCCQYHDHCYENVQKNGCDTGLGEASLLLEYYKYKVTNGVVFCGSDNTRCGQMLCACDKKIAECFQSHEFHPENQHSRLF